MRDTLFRTERRWMKYPTSITSSETWCEATVFYEDGAIVEVWYEMDTARIVVAA